MKSSESEKCQTPTPTTEYASVVLGVWQYGKATGIAKDGEGKDPAALEWRDLARRGCLGRRSTDVRSFEGSWQYGLAARRSDPVGGHLGLVERHHPDRSVCRSAALVDGCAGTNRPGNLSRVHQGADHLDSVLAAVAVGPPASADGGTRGRTLVRRTLGSVGGGWLAHQRATHQG